MANNATAYEVIIEPATPNADGWVWRAVDVSHVPDSENGGNHNVYVNILDEHGKDLRGVNGARVADGPRVLYGWEGQRADEAVPPLVLDKPVDEWGTNFPLYRGQHAWVSVVGGGVPSDTVLNLHTGFASEGSGTSDGHHSYRVAFRLVKVQAEPPPVVEPVAPDEERAAIVAGLRGVAGVLKSAEIDLEHLAAAVEAMRSARG